MKRILNFSSVGLVLIAAMFLYSCEDEPTGPVNVDPVVSLLSSSDLTLEPMETFTIDFSASIGDDSPLKSVTVYEDGTKVPFSRLTVNGTAAASNAILLFGDDVDGLSWSIDVVAQSITSTSTYEVEVQDEAGQTGSAFVTVTTVGTPPTLTTTSPMTIEVLQDIKNLFRLTAVKGSGDLVSIEVRENDQFVDPSKIFWQTIGTSVSENPFLLGEDDKGGFDEQELFIMTPESEGNFIYRVILTDEFGSTAELSFDVTTLPSGTAVEMLEGVLLNAGGGQGTGGLDLDNGMSTNSDDAEAEIRDNGIDTDLPADENWLRTISPIADNGVSMRYLKAGEGGLPEDFSFASIAFKEDLPLLFDNGIELTDGASDVVMIEDVFIVERDGKYWVLEVIQVETTFQDNADNYIFDVKF
ncbi:MAG: hypothetical protein P1U56_15015 [Saprospiraceae bacterium]|nr:hypothetical protein [Saprospiraceae bacterium]